jgi:hypothetical protein
MSESRLHRSAAERDFPRAGADGARSMKERALAADSKAAQGQAPPWHAAVVNVNQYGVASPGQLAGVTIPYSWTLR